MNDAPSEEDDQFLINEGFDLLAGFRAIKSTSARKAVIFLIASIVEAESEADGRENTASADDSARFDH